MLFIYGRDVFIDTSLLFYTNIFRTRSFVQQEFGLKAKLISSTLFPLNTKN